MSDVRMGHCPRHGRVVIDFGDDGHIADDGPAYEVGIGHAPGCWGECDRHGCPVPVQVQADSRYPCGPVDPEED